MSPRVRDVVVIGAGPAGAVTAARLAARGLDVVLMEEHEAIGDPVHCTGLLGFDAFDEFDLPKDLVLGETGSARFWGAAGQSVAVDSARIRAAVIDRPRLDRTLADRAVAAGADLRTGARVDAVRVAGDSVHVTPRAGTTIRARAAVLACGANYRFHRPLGLGVPKVFLQSAQIEAPFPGPAGSGGVEIRFGRDVAPAGFAWLVPLRRGDETRARIGLMTETRSRDRFRAFVTLLCARAGADRAAMPAPRLKMLPLSPIPKTFGTRVLAVGDAAGLVKPTTGGGIYYGMLSGVMAADTLADALGRDRLDESTLARYEQRWRQRLGGEIRVGLSFRRIASRLSDESIDALIELGRVNGVVPLLQDTASFNWHRKAAIALLAHPSVRRIVLKSWRTSAGLL